MCVCVCACLCVCVCVHVCTFACMCAKAPKAHLQLLLGVQANDYRAAIQEYDLALEVDPDHFKSLFNKGFSHDKVEQCVCVCLCVCVSVCVCMTLMQHTHIHTRTNDMCCIRGFHSLSTCTAVCWSGKVRYAYVAIYASGGHLCGSSGKACNQNKKKVEKKQAGQVRLAQVRGEPGWGTSLIRPAVALSPCSP